MGVGIRRSFRALLAGSLLLGSVAVGSLAVGSLPASANTADSLYVSTSGSDGGGSSTCTASATPCLTIQQAINEAQSNYSTTDDVTINVAAGTYSELDTINASSLDSLTIIGAGSSTTAVTPPGFGTPLTVNSGTVTISGLTLENGFATTVEGGDIINNGTLTLYSSTVSNGDGDIAGGGIYNTGTMTLDLSTVSGGNISHIGGGIYNAGTMTINSSTVSGNYANQGGGICNAGTMTINSSTVSGNTGGFSGGITNAITVGGGMNGATLAVNSSTVSGNTAAQRGGGIYSYGGTVTTGASIVAANTGPNCYSPGGSFTSLGYNLTDDPSNANYCGFTASTDVLDAKPGLGPLTNNGGPTFTQLPAANGPAVQVIPTDTTLNSVKVCPRIDQRGVASIGKCTIGAVEQHGVWQSQVQGYPAFPAKDTPPPGFLIGVKDSIWKLYSHNVSGTDLFTGTITTNGTFSDVALTLNDDSGDTMTMVNPHTISFRFHTAGYVSGVKFVSSGSEMAFTNLKENGTLVPPADILLGNPTTSATSNPLTITRP